MCRAGWRRPAGHLRVVGHVDHQIESHKPAVRRLVPGDYNCDPYLAHERSDIKLHRAFV